MRPAAALPGTRMAARVWPADVGVAWLCETVDKIDAGVLIFGRPPVAPRTRVSISSFISGSASAATTDGGRATRGRPIARRPIGAPAPRRAQGVGGACDLVAEVMIAARADLDLAVRCLTGRRVGRTHQRRCLGRPG